VPDFTAPIHSCSTAPKTDQRLCLPLGSMTTNFSNEEAGLLKFCCINQTLIGQLQFGNYLSLQLLMGTQNIPSNTYFLLPFDAEIGAERRPFMFTPPPNRNTRNRRKAIASSFNNNLRFDSASAPLGVPLVVLKRGSV
jgi:hypothetical protein